jgi:hypothetical protein
VVSGEHIKLSAARVDASGRAGGGKVLIGGDWGGGKPNTSLVKNQSAALEPYVIPTATTVSVDGATTINASATERGNGGKVILWSDSNTTFAGTILARGGLQGGDGGFVETSSRQQLAFTGNVDTRAPKGAAGTLLLDPADFSISLFCEGSNCMTAAALAGQLEKQSVVIATQNNAQEGNGDIIVGLGAQVTWQAPTTLTLSAYHDINMLPLALLQNTGAGNVVLRADNTGTGSGTVNFSTAAVVDFSQSTGTVSIYYNPTAIEGGIKYENPRSFACSGLCLDGGVLVNSQRPSQLTSYMLVNDANDLQLVGTNDRTLGGTYALGNNFSASPSAGFTGFAPGTIFTGLFDGNGGLGVNYTVSDLRTLVFPIIGNGATVRNLNLADVDITATASPTLIGALAGENRGTISNVHVLSGTVSGGSQIGVAVGGLVGQNSGLIASSSSAAAVSVGASNSATGSNIAGGLVAINLGTITGSSAGGSISGGAFSLVGGLVGQNVGEVTSSFAQSGVSVGSSGTGGGLIGFNSGAIAGTSATGNVTGAAGNGQGGSTTLGGLVGINQGLIADSQASSSVGTANVADLQAGGLVGNNSGTTALIENSTAIGNVTVGSASVAGGLAGTSNGTIVASSASGAVTGGSNSVLGGFIGTLTFQENLQSPQISGSFASGSVTSTGPNSVVGGFVGLSGGTIFVSSASGAVTGTSASYLGGFVGTNLGLIEQSTASGNVTGSGSNNIVGGFVGANFGTIDSSSASGNATSGADSVVGGFAGSNAQFVNFQPGSIPGSSFPVGTITNSSASGTASGGAGSTVSSFIALNNPNSSSNPPAFPSIIAGCTDPTCVFVNTGQLPSASTPAPPTPPNPTPTPEPQPLTPPTPPTPTPTTEPQSPTPQTQTASTALAEQLAAQQTQQILNLTSTLQFAALSIAPVVNTTQGGIRLPPQQAPGAGPGTGTGTGPGAGNQFLPPGIDRRIIDIPPPSETRLKTDEVMVQIRTDLGVERLRAAVANLGVSILASEDLSILGSTAVRLHIDNGRTPAEVIEALAAVQLIAVAQPQYVYNLDQAAPAPAPTARSDAPPGDTAQYILQKLNLADVHRMVRGTNMPIAVIDSEIDAAHPDLEGAVTQRYDAVGTPDKPHPHGTGMAGAIGAHQRLLGTAPAARLLAVHAFSTSGASPESTTFNILKGINWAVNQGVRVINMSFAGPKDPSLERALKVAYDRNIVLIAAAGNAGPKSPPLYPGAYPDVIAVTATDVDDRLFAGANRGKYVSLSAPGVDILVPAPESTYQLTTGTSVAAAEVSGIVALLLERNPKLTPADIRRILTLSARRLGPGERDDNFGAGLIDPLKALQLADPRSATTAPPAVRQR